MPWPQEAEKHGATSNQDALPARCSPAGKKPGESKRAGLFIQSALAAKPSARARSAACQCGNSKAKALNLLLN